MHDKKITIGRARDGALQAPALQPDQDDFTVFHG
jgi:hypothetical protein